MLGNKNNKINVYFLVDFNSLNVFLNIYSHILEYLNKNKVKIHIINIENNVTEKSFLNKKKLKFLSFFDPKNLKEFESYLTRGKGIIVKNYVDVFRNYRINFAIKKIGYQVIEISNLGNIQQSEYYYINKNLSYIKKILVYYLPKKLAVIFSYIGLFKKISIRFESNHKLYSGFKINKNKNFFLRTPTKYLDMINVKSIQFEKKYKVSNKYITFLEFDPEYQEQKRSNVINKTDLKKYYMNMNKFLKKLEDLYQKKIIICIHPNYDQKKIQKKFSKYKVVKFQTQKYIQNSEIILFYDSSAIVDAIFLKKKIISIISSIYKGKNNKSDLYKRALNLHSVDIDIPFELKKKDLDKKLNLTVKNYKKYLFNYASINSKYGKSKILEEIKKLNEIE